MLNSLQLYRRRRTLYAASLVTIGYGSIVADGDSVLDDKKRRPDMLLMRCLHRLLTGHLELVDSTSKQHQQQLTGSRANRGTLSVLMPIQLLYTVLGVVRYS